MALTQGSPLPNITTTQGTVTTAPGWYTDYLSGLAQGSANAAGAANFVGAQPLQTRAFEQVGQTVGSYQPTLTAATNMVTGAGTTRAPDVVADYMNPYTQQVVNQIGELGQRAIQQNLSPSATAGAVGSGQFGSKRGAEVLGQVIRDANQNILAQQTGALSSGFKDAMAAAQTDLARQMGAGERLGTLAQQTQTQNLADINALAILGEQEQKIKQAEQLFPLQTLGMAAQNLRGFSIPTSTASTYTGPIPGAYAASPLQQIAGLGALLGGVSSTPFGKAAGEFLGGLFSKLPTLSFGSTTTPTNPLDSSAYPSFDDMMADVYGYTTNPNYYGYDYDSSWYSTPNTGINYANPNFSDWEVEP
jgi:hypothetical protein